LRINSEGGGSKSKEKLGKHIQKDGLGLQGGNVGFVVLFLAPSAEPLFYIVPR
jgi:hypothetical protein